MNTNISTTEFIYTIFPPDLLRDDEHVLLAHPDSFINGAGQEVNFYRQMPFLDPRVLRSKRGWLYCVSTVCKPLGRLWKRRLSDVRTAMVIVCDDVGTKSKNPPVGASYVLETSRRNYQWGYLLEPYDVNPEQVYHQSHYDACCVALAQAGFNDIGCRGATRCVKLPGAIHKSGFVTRLMTWEPDRIWTLDDLMEDMGVGVMEFSAEQYGKTYSKRTSLTIKDVEDEVLDWLEGREGSVQSLQKGGSWIIINCPWSASHTDPADRLAGYSPLDLGFEGRAFKCHHGHCSERTTGDFLAWVVAQGGPELEGWT